MANPAPGDPYRRLAIRILESCCTALRSESDSDRKAARSLGYESSRAEVLDFLCTDWAENVIALALGWAPGKVNDLIQAMLDKYAPGIVVKTREELEREGLWDERTNGCHWQPLETKEVTIEIGGLCVRIRDTGPETTC